MIISKKYLPLALLAITELARADCPEAMTQGVSVSQHQFADGLKELVISQPDAKTVTRLSFGGGKQAGCHFPLLALLKGGDWGWHVVWTSNANRGVFYARVDGEAWVSSLPKKLVSQPVDAIKFSEKDGLLQLTYHLTSDEVPLTHTMISNDEGRNWEAADLHQ